MIYATSASAHARQQAEQYGAEDLLYLADNYPANCAVIVGERRGDAIIAIRRTGNRDGKPITATVIARCPSRCNSFQLDGLPVVKVENTRS